MTTMINLFMSEYVELDQIRIESSQSTYTVGFRFK